MFLRGSQFGTQTRRPREHVRSFFHPHPGTVPGTCQAKGPIRRADR